MRYILILLLAVPLISKGQIVKKTDEFTGNTSWQSENPREIVVEKGDIYRGLYFAAYSENSWVISIYAVSQSETIYSNDTIYLLVDGKRMQFPVITRDMDYDSGSLTSYIVFTPSEDQFQEIGFAETVRVKIGTNIFNIPKDARVDMRRMSRKVSEERTQG